MKRGSWLLLTLAFLLIFSAPSLAEDDDATDDDATDDDAGDDDATDDDATDDDAGDDDATDDDATDDDATDDDAEGNPFEATLVFMNPEALEPSQAYDFEFTVTNTSLAGADSQHWITLVDLFMPSTDYVIDPDGLHAPEKLHGGTWSVDTLEDDNDGNVIGIQWAFTLILSSEFPGDIQEGDSLEFAFRATTDENATDGFDFKLTADSTEEVTGVAYIVEPEEDDDDDDDDDAGGDDDDDDDDDGCGC